VQRVSVGCAGVCAWSRSNLRVDPASPVHASSVRVRAVGECTPSSMHAHTRPAVRVFKSRIGACESTATTNRERNATRPRDEIPTTTNTHRYDTSIQADSACIEKLKSSAVADIERKLRAVARTLERPIRLD
jgi:hypothetical protein